MHREREELLQLREAGWGGRAEGGTSSLASSGYLSESCNCLFLSPQHTGSVFRVQRIAKKISHKLLFLAKRDQWANFTVLS